MHAVIMYVGKQPIVKRQSRHCVQVTPKKNCPSILNSMRHRAPMPMQKLQTRAFITASASMLLTSTAIAMTWQEPLPADGKSERQIVDLSGGKKDGLVVATWREEMDDNQEQIEFFALSFDAGKTFHHETETTYQIRLKYGCFDPLVADTQPAVPGHLQVGEFADAERGVFIVQFITQPLQEYRDAIEDSGGTIHKFLADHAYLVELDAEALARIQQLPFVRWVGHYQPAYKLEEELLNLVRVDPALMQATRLNIQVFERGLNQKMQVAELVAQIGGGVDAMIADGFIIEATLDGNQLLQVLQLPAVQFVDRWSLPETDMDIVRTIGGANYIEGLTGFTGEGVRGEVMDGSLLGSHSDFQSNPPIFHTGTFGNPNHGTACYGINFGDGTGNASARGLAPDAQGIFASYFDFGNRYTHTAELLQSPYFAVYQTNSWGSNRTTQYNSKSAEMDDILFINDILICQSQSNAGNQNSRPQAWAKNIVAVGGVQHGDTLDRSDDSWNGAASIGPAADGRIKPDLTHFNELIFTTEGDGSYDHFGGTSGATPIVAGHFALLFQMWSEEVFGNETTGNTVFANRPHMSTAKALMINTASSYDWTNGGDNSDLIRTRQGWGLPDLQTMYDRSEKFFIVNEEVVLQNLQAATFPVFVASGEPELRATLVYTDPSGTTSSSQHRINDLTLKVTSPSGVTYWGNHGLHDGIYSTAGGSANTIDTVENVFLPSPESGTWTVEVIASEVNEDSHVETAGVVDADFALVVSGVSPGSNVASVEDVTVLFGSLLSGGVSELEASDDGYLRMQSSFGFLSSEPNVIRVLIGLETTVDNASTLQVSIESQLNNPSGTMAVRLRNWQTNGLETIGTAGLSTVDSTVVFDNIDADDHVRSGDGRIEVELKDVVVATFSLSGFIASIDHVEVMVE